MARYRYDKEVGKLIPLEDWLEKYDARPKSRAFYYTPDIPAYECVVTNKVINSRPEREAMMREHDVVDYRDTVSIMDKQERYSGLRGKR